MFEELPDSHHSFHYSVLTESLVALKTNTFLDNFDADRYNLDGNDHSMEFNALMHSFVFEWFISNSTSLYSAYQKLDDVASKHLYLHILAFRLAGHLSVRIPVDFTSRNDAFQTYKACEKSTPSDPSIIGVFKSLRHYDFHYKEHQYKVDCHGLDYYLFRNQYFYQKNGVRIQPELADFVIDGGACMGDTAAVFSNAVGENGHVFSFDPVAEHIDLLNHNIKQFPHQNVTPMPYGLSDHNVDAPPIIVNQYAPGFRANGQTIPCRTLDALVEQGTIPQIDFIKLDVEGAELETLRGAHHSIERFKPKLAISLYHNPNDIFEIILLIKDKYPFYSCHIDHYTIHYEETVLYCLPNPQAKHGVS